MAEETPEGLDNVDFAREVIKFLKLHAEELKQKGLPVDEMIRNIERQLEEVLRLKNKLGLLQAEDELMTQKRAAIRQGIDTTAFPPDLVDGMSTISYLQAALEKEKERRRRGKKGVGG